MKRFLACGLGALFLLLVLAMLLEIGTTHELERCKLAAPPSRVGPYIQILVKDDGSIDFDKLSELEADHDFKFKWEDPKGGSVTALLNKYFGD